MMGINFSGRSRGCGGPSLFAKEFGELYAKVYTLKITGKFTNHVEKSVEQGWNKVIVHIVHWEAEGQNG